MNIEFTSEEIEAMKTLSEKFNKIADHIEKNSNYVLNYDETDIGIMAARLLVFHNYLIDNSNKLILD